MNRELINFYAFITGLLLAVMMCFPSVTRAAVSAVPVVSGYSAGSFSAAAGTYTTAANGASYGASGIVNVAGKSVTVPATLRMAANAGQFVKNGLKLNPWAIAGTIAAGWLLDQGLEYLNGSWVKHSGDPVADVYYWSGYAPCYDVTSKCSLDGAKASVRNYHLAYAGMYAWEWTTACRVDAPNVQVFCAFRYKWSSGEDWINGGEQPFNYGGTRPLQPVTDADWEALPDPLPVLAPELPYADYMPDGAPVEAPSYDFVPFSVPTGDPYTKPDGSTAQPMAKVSPSADGVTLDLYEQPLTDAQGNPVPNAPPVDTAEPAPSQCAEFPNSLACLEMGSVSDVTLGSEVRNIASIAPVSLGGAGSCPADLTASFMGQPVVFSWAIPCQAAQWMRPLVLLFTWVSAGLIFIQGVRN